MRGVRFVVLGVAVAAAGCRACKDDHPYVPYSIEDAPAPAASEGDAAAPQGAAPDAGGFHAREAVRAPKDAARWALDGLSLVAPADRVFVLGLTGDFDGDGTLDAAALVARAGAEDAGPGATELVLYRGGGPPEVVATSPVANDASCAPVQRLALVGRHTLAVELGARCDSVAGTRWVSAILVGARDARAHFAATLLDPPLAPALSLDIDGSDRDGDGLDDVAVRVSLEGGAPPFEPGPRVSAVVQWFDRPAGMSRDAVEPEASFRALATAAASRAPRAKDAPAVPRTVEQVRALYRALCAEGGSPRVTDLLGARALSCGTSKGLEEAGLAEVRAYVTQGDAARAIAALDRAPLAPATRTVARGAEAQQWISQIAPVAAAPSVLRAVGAIPQMERSAAPSWGALAFEASGKLLVRTAAGVVRVDPVQGDEASAADVATWRIPVVSPDGALRWTQAYDACDGVALHASFAATGSETIRDVPLPIAPPMGTRCDRAGAHGNPVPAQAVAWGAGGLEAIVAGEPVLVSPDLARATSQLAPLGQPVTLGAPRSPGGRVVVEPTSMGVLVRGARARLFRAPELEGGYAELRDCTVSDDAARVACLRGGRAFVGVWTPE